MAKRIIQMYDKYQSTTKVYPKIIKECLQEDVLDFIEEQVIANPELAGTENKLESIEINGTKYEIGGGGDGAILLVDETDVTTVNPATISFSENDISVQFGEISPKLNNIVYLFDDNTGNITGIYIISNSSVVSEETIYEASIIGTISSGKKLYTHNICIYRNDADVRTYIFFNIITSSSSVMTLADTISLLQSRSYTDNILRAYPATGFYINLGVTTPTTHPIVNVHANASLNTQLYYGYKDGADNNPSMNSTLISTNSTKYTFTDTVNEV